MKWNSFYDTFQLSASDFLLITMCALNSVRGEQLRVKQRSHSGFSEVRGEGRGPGGGGRKEGAGRCGLRCGGCGGAPAGTKDSVSQSVTINGLNSWGSCGVKTSDTLINKDNKSQYFTGVTKHCRKIGQCYRGMSYGINRFRSALCWRHTLPLSLYFSLGHTGCHCSVLTLGGSSCPDPTWRRGTVHLVLMTLPMTGGTLRLVPPDGHLQETLKNGAFLTSVTCMHGVNFYFHREKYLDNRKRSWMYYFSF